MNDNVVIIKVEWNIGDKGITGLIRKQFEVVQVIKYAETEIAKGPHLLVKFEDGGHRIVPTSGVTKLMSV